MQLYMLNKKPRIYFFEKILIQMQGRKLITLGIFKLERNMQKQCLCGCFMFFQSMFGKWKNICFPMMITFTTTCFDFPQSVNCFFITWVVLFFLADSTYICFTIIGGGGLAFPAWSRYTLMDSSRLLERPLIIIWLLMWGLISNINHQFLTKFKVFCTSILFIHCIYCLTVDCAQIRDIS